MGKFEKIHWFWYCLLVFLISRFVMAYQYNIASEVLLHTHRTFSDMMCKWDCKWYLTIVNNGYDAHIRTSGGAWKGLANWAFFPLYPTLISAVTFVLGSPAILTGIILNQIFILIACCYFYHYLRLSFDEKMSRFGVFLLAFSPFSVYFASVYTEAMFIMLSIMSFYYLKTKHYFLSALCSGFLSATRPVGMMMSPAFVLGYFRKKGITFSLVILAAISIFGLACYMTYLYYLTGDALAFKHIQAGWGRTGWKMDRLHHQLWSIIQDTHNFVLFIIAIIMSIILYRNKYYEEALFNLFCVLPGAITGTMMSEGRFSGTLFTFYLGLTILSNKSATFKICIAGLFILLYLSYYLYWLGHSTFLI